MKRFAVFFMTMCILGQATVRTAWVLHYQWNRAVYLRHCENRDKPQLKCDGKCYLKKRIASSEGADPAQPRLPDSFRSVKDLLLFCDLPVATTAAQQPMLQEGRSKRCYYITPMRGEAHRPGVFRPPSPVDRGCPTA